MQVGEINGKLRREAESDMRDQFNSSKSLKLKVNFEIYIADRKATTCI